MSSKKLLTLYTQLLDTAGLTVTSDGCVSVKPQEEGETPTPFTVKGKRLVLPTNEYLKNPTPKTVVFHPLLENAMRGESEVFTEFRKALTLRTNLAVLDLIQDLLVLAASPSQHNKLNPDQSEVLSILKGCNDKTVATFSKIIEKIPTDKLYHRAVKFFMKPSGKIGDKSYTRLGVVSFPLYESFVKDEKVEGVEIAEKHRVIIKKAFEYILPNLDKPHEYSRGSNSQVAPMFDAMIRSLASVCQAITGIQRLFEDVKIPDLFQNNYTFSSDWWDDMQNIDALLPLIRQVPMQPGNEGSVGAADQNNHETEQTAVHKAALPNAATALSAAATPAAPVMTQTATLPAAYQNQPVAQQQPQSNRPMTYAERVALGQQRQQQAMQQGNVQYMQGPNGTLIPVQVTTSVNTNPYGPPVQTVMPLNQPVMNTGVNYGVAQPMGYQQPGSGFNF